MNDDGIGGGGSARPGALRQSAKHEAIPAERQKSKGKYQNGGIPGFRISDSRANPQSAICVAVERVNLRPAVDADADNAGEEEGVLCSCALSRAKVHRPGLTDPRRGGIMRCFSGGDRHAAEKGRTRCAPAGFPPL
ncbi:MAG TPA: hypothetical protein PLU87_19150, partial [Sedimentisphaerales bacterium]|nr:hypothetical protein [Sedimentisphaerales bacterium]HRS13214.1 hypothetical protein [Sedimentisphaerales bacterium]HRV49810.1 hypothetical protein [Sedimentisphaerales bacterium]